MVDIGIGLCKYMARQQAIESFDKECRQARGMEYMIHTPNKVVGYYDKHGVPMYEATGEAEDPRRQVTCKAMFKYDGCGYLNKPFDGGVPHHIEHDIVIHIPEDIHRNNKHNIIDGEGMEKINDAAFAFLSIQRRSEKRVAGLGRMAGKRKILRDRQIAEITVQQKQWKHEHPMEQRDHVLPVGWCDKLNKRFDGSHGHHIDPFTIIYIPGELHNSIYHNLRTGQGMEEINRVAMDWLQEIRRESPQTALSSLG